MKQVQKDDIFVCVKPNAYNILTRVIIIREVIEKPLEKGRKAIFLKIESLPYHRKSQISLPYLLGNYVLYDKEKHGDLKLLLK